MKNHIHCWTIVLTSLLVVVAACGEDEDETTNITPDTGELTTVATATFVGDGAGGAPDATGMVTIATNDADTTFVTLGADFMQEMGPGDTQLFFTTGSGSVAEQMAANAAGVSAVIGTIANGFSGTTTFEVPSSVNSSAFSNLIVWCPTAGVNFGVATFGEQAGGQPMIVRTGELVGDGDGGAPDATGSVQLVEAANGSLTLNFGADFVQEMGPGDTQVFLTTGAGSINDLRGMSAMNVSAVLGTITNGATGEQSFTLPAGITSDAFSHATVWCPTAEVVFGTAALQ